MTLRNISAGSVITARVYKLHVGYKWANNYEIQAVNDIPDPEFALQSLADRLVALERAIHLNITTIDRVTISTYAPDSQPYNPDTLASFPYNQNGQRAISSDILPLEACLFVRRNVDFGRDGRLLYRGCLTEADVATTGMRMALLTAAINALQGAITSWYNPGLGSNWRFVMASGTPNPTNIRAVIGLQVHHAITFKKFNNRYFRRRQ
jgi:hypothetical protein